MKTIQRAYKSLSGICNLNRGGCLYAAYGVFLYLRKYNVHREVCLIQHAIFFDYEVENNLNFLSGKNDVAGSGYHFSLSPDNGGTCYDSDGVNIQKIGVIILPDKVEEFCISALKNGRWNSMFNLDDVYTIARILRVPLKPYQ